MKPQHYPSLISFLSTALLLHLHPFSAAAYSGSATANDTNFIRTSCQTTLYPDLCYTSLSVYANKVQQDPALLAQVAIGVSLSKIRRVAAYVSNLSRQANTGANPRAASALQDCVTVFGDAVDQICHSLRQMRHRSGSREALMFQMSNVQTYMSAALTNEDTCVDGFEFVPNGPVKTGVCDRVVKVEEVTSIALALVNSYVAKIRIP